MSARVHEYTHHDAELITEYDDSGEVIRHVLYMDGRKVRLVLTRTLERRLPEWAEQTRRDCEDEFQRLTEEEYRNRDCEPPYEHGDPPICKHWSLP